MARRAVPAALAALTIVTLAPGSARADDDYGGGSVVFARGAALYRVDPRGRNETELAQLSAKTSVRALRSDARGKVLLADLAGRWAWMPLDGSAKSLIDLPCADGPAQLAEDGTAVICRSPKSANRSLLVELGERPTPTAIDVPPASARLIGGGAERKLVWADRGGVWIAPPRELQKKSRLAPDAPLRGFLPSPDGTRALGVYADQIYTSPRATAPGEVLMSVQLDGRGARRKTIRDGVAVDWSHDGQWVLVQDGARACLMRATGGQYKCWKGYTAASVSSDGRWGLVLGNRDGAGDGAKKDEAKKGAKKGKAGKRGGRPERPVKPDPEPPAPAAPPTPIDEPIDEPTDEPEAGDAPAVLDDVSVAPPSGPLSLFRVRLEGAFTDRPALLVKVVDGAAVWVP